MAIKNRIYGTLLLSFLLFSTIHSFYLPGVSPRDFQKGDPLYVKVNKLSSTKTQLPYDYYYLNYCKPPKILNTGENLGEVLRGDRIENSVYTITIVLCYFQLCSEDYNWWWRAYLTSGSSSLYLFLYSIFYFFTKLEISKLVSGLLYFGYMIIISYSFFVLTGTIGFYACLWFVRKIYSSVKLD